jgi:hypothetical protein
MMILVDRCPFYSSEMAIPMPSGPIAVRGYQIIVWVSLSVGGARSRPFPAVLDTGHSHNFSIREVQLRQWTGWEPTEMGVLGTIRMNEWVVTLREAAIAIHPNVPERRDEIGEEP